MPTPTTAKWAKPKNEDEFEDISVDFLRLRWRDPHAARNGRRGQRQHGVDILGRPARLSGRTAGAQCKNTDKLTLTDVIAEVDKAQGFPEGLGELLILTSSDRDAKLQADVRAHVTKTTPPFGVELVFWDDITAEIAQDPVLVEKHWKGWGRRRTVATALLVVIAVSLGGIAVAKLWSLSPGQPARSEAYPQVAVRSIEIGPIDIGGSLKTTVHICNVGTETAQNLRAEVAGIVVPDPVNVPSPMTQFSVPATSILPLGPGMCLSLEPVNSTQLIQNQADVSLITSGSWVPWISGRVEYDGVNGERCWTMFRAHYSATARMYIFADKGNEARCPGSPQPTLTPTTTAIREPDITQMPTLTVHATNVWPFQANDSSYQRRGKHRLVLTVSNSVDVDIRDLRAKIQLPEAIVRPPEIAAAGNATFAPCGTAMASTLGGTGPRGTGSSIRTTGTRTTISVGPAGSSASIMMPIPQLRSCAATRPFSTDKPTGIWQLSVDRLPARGVVELAFVTSATGTAKPYADEIQHHRESAPSTPGRLLFYVAGSFSYQRIGRMQSVDFIVPIFAPDPDQVSSGPTEQGMGTWGPVLFAADNL